MKSVKRVPIPAQGSKNPAENTIFFFFVDVQFIVCMCVYVLFFVHVL
jgi:hypothetical protein